MFNVPLVYSYDTVPVCVEEYSFNLCLWFHILKKGSANYTQNLFIQIASLHDM